MLNAWRVAVHAEVMPECCSLTHASDPLSHVSAPSCSTDWGMTVSASPNCAQVPPVLAACRTHRGRSWCWLGICDKPSIHL